MKTTLLSMHGATAAPCVVVLPTAVPLQGTGVPAALRFRTDVDGSVDAARPPRGAPV